MTPTASDCKKLLARTQDQMRGGLCSRYADEITSPHELLIYRNNITEAEVRTIMEILGNCHRADQWAKAARNYGFKSFDGRGGAREGAGKPKTIPDGCKPWTVRVTDAERQQLETELKKLRA